MYQDLLSQQKEINETVKELNKQGTMLNNFSSANLKEIIPKVNNLNSAAAYLIAQSKRYPSVPPAASKITEASAEAERKIEAAANTITALPKIDPPKIKLITEASAEAEKKVESAAQSKNLTGMPMLDLSLAPPIASYEPKTA